MKRPAILADALRIIASISMVLSLILALSHLTAWPLAGNVWSVNVAEQNTLTLRGALEVVVAHKGDSWLTIPFGPHWSERNCTFQGLPLACHYVSVQHAAGNATAESMLQRAAAMLNVDCFDPAAIPAQVQQLPQVMLGMESITNAPCMDAQPGVDIEMSYRECSQVWSPYWGFPSQILTLSTHEDLAALMMPPLLFEQRKNAIIYVNSNCYAKNGRHQIMMQLQELLKSSNSSLELHSYGNCGPNMDAAALADFRNPTSTNGRFGKKIEYFQKYKFCVAMENSIDRDYVSEKVHNALIAGCIPIYWGAPNVADFLPHTSAIIDYSTLGSPQALQKELERLAHDKVAYEAKLQWKKWDTEQFNQGFQRLITYGQQPPLCRLCQFMTQLIQTGMPSNKFTLCRANKTWTDI